MRALAIGLLLFAQVLFAQVTASPSDDSPAAKRSDTWILFGGYSYAYAGQNKNYPGWNASVTEYPYPSHPWIGGTIEASGGYRSQSGTTYGSYTVMGGPAFNPCSGYLRPFARVLLGGVINTTSAAPGSSAAPAPVKSFGVDVGGGVDFYLTDHWGFREQGDWISSSRNGSRANMGKGAIGVVFLF